MSHLKKNLDIFISLEAWWKYMRNSFHNLSFHDLCYSYITLLVKPKVHNVYWNTPGTKMCQKKKSVSTKSKVLKYSQNYYLTDNLLFITQGYNFHFREHRKEKSFILWLLLCTIWAILAYISITTLFSKIHSI